MVQIDIPMNARKKVAKKAFKKLINLRKKHPIGTTEEIIVWKDKNRK